MTVELAGLVASAAPWILRRAIAFAGDVGIRRLKMQTATGRFGSRSGLESVAGACQSRDNP